MQKDKELLGNIFDIQRFTVHDGPGVRTEFFMKGCPMRCLWCGNPESQKNRIQLGVYSKKCLGKKICGDCIDVCPQKDALIFSHGKLKAIDESKCDSCLKCVNVCFSETIKQWGEYKTVAECMDIILRDRSYYNNSGGGVTISGGDALLQADFVASLFTACHNEQVHTCFESDFFGSWKPISTILPLTDLFIADIKHMNDAVHKEQTGVSNESILDNLVKLSDENAQIVLRIPVIPKFNDSIDNMTETAEFIINKMNNRVRVLQLLSFMRLGEEKYKALNREYPMKGTRIHRPSFTRRVNEYADFFNEIGINCVVGTKDF